MAERPMPIGKIGRLLTGGGTAVRAGGKIAGYYAKRPFLTGRDRCRTRESASRESARALFQGLSLLKGTALKVAQMLSLEMDLLPEEIRRELAKSYHQVPPINRALVRKVVHDGLGQPPEALFSRFDSNAFAAASLGQVHRAADAQGRDLAVKIQYPGIAKTIRNDMALAGRLLAPLIAADLLRPALDEIEARLHEEVDYLREAGNTLFFANHLVMDSVRVPRVLPELSSGTVLTTTMMPGKPLDRWLADNPGQNARDRVAQTLSDMVLKGLYELHVIHADPNPGNFIIAEDLTVGLVDFGCVKRLNPGFVEQYRQLALAAAHNDNDLHFDLMTRLGLIPADLDAATRQQVQAMSAAAGAWFGRLFVQPFFDFRNHPGFIGQGQATMRRFHSLHRHLRVNPDFIFLDRTRYGLLRLFEQMKARVSFRNRFEW